MAGLMNRLRLSYNILANKVTVDEPSQVISSELPSAGYGLIWRDSSSAVLSPLQNRIAIDAANVPMGHVRLDENGRFVDRINSELNDRLTRVANIDQTGPVFIQDAVMTMLEHGSAVLVPVDVTTNPERSTAYDILSLRIGTVTEWFNRSVGVKVYNERSGAREEVILPKSFVAIAYNPLYSIMNAPNSTLKRLIDKLALLDVADAKIGSPNLDLILQLPFATKNDRREKEALRRIQVLEEQLANSRYGIAYVDGTEKITQLNRPVTNALADQVKYLTDTLYNQLGLTESVFNGTASDEEMLAYYNRTVKPILDAITGAIVAAFLTKTAVAQGQSVKTFPDLFKMSPVSVLAEAADSFTRNEIMSSNEVRSLLGLKPVADPAADELRNKNLNKESEDTTDAKPDRSDEA